MQDGGIDLGVPSVGNRGVGCRFLGAFPSLSHVALRVRSTVSSWVFGDCIGGFRESVPPVSHQLHAWHNRPVLLQNLCQVPSEAPAPLLHEGHHLTCLLAAASDGTGFRSGVDLDPGPACSAGPVTTQITAFPVPDPCLFPSWVTLTPI